MADPRHVHILDTARALLAAGPIPTARTVASEAGMSLSTYYRFVGSHAALLQAAGHHDEPTTRDRLLTAAAELLAEVGFSRLLMEEVAMRAGVSRGTLYRIFPGKASLFAAMAQARSPLADLGTVLKTVESLPPADVLPSMLQIALPRMLENRGIIRAILAEAAIDSGGGEAGRAVVRQLYRDLEVYMAAQMAAGRLRRMPPITAVQSLLGPLLIYAVVRPEFWSDGAAPGESTPSPAETVAEFVQTWLRGMAPDAPADASPAE